MAKLIKTDNFDRDQVADQLVYDQLTMQEAQQMADDYNSAQSETSQWFYRAVEDDHRFYRGMADLV